MKRLNFFCFSFLCVLVSACGVSREIREDFRTETYKSRTKNFSEKPLRQGQIVFFGNSITQAGAWQAYFPDMDVANRGISGDNTEGMLARIGEIVEAKPRKFFIMAGINDISLSRPNRKILKNYREIIRTIKSGSLQTQIYIQSVLPINNDFARYKRLLGKESQVESLNQDLRLLALDEDVAFINLYPFFVDDRGKLNPQYTSDGLHLTPQAYFLWTSLIRRYIK